ncbi:MFS transporter [Aneurinibacillus sp. Ricciae_BoGa-3]|uniref:MFS transporter n=1 Tax=Aneurinibacillus sp. Ricciae_BoGa-3 TaxID=3022697 RepID=UPI0023409530|nr:MFS transporter [Aneurinibacillus sp. Ricciae_BoGa-3]WCK56308.1 MFS transporter [Aneurinibacillus sp. Ricciae_BoGa-3]
MSKSKLWTKDFLIVSAANFFLYFTFYLLVATITIYATEKFQASPSMAGLASGIFVLGALIARLFAGRSIEQVGRKKMLYIGFIFILIVTLLYFAVNSVTFLLVIRFLHGVAFGIASTATGTIVGNIIPAERRGEGIGYYALSLTLAAAIGPFLGMFLTQHTSFSMNFVLCTLLLAVSFIASLFLKVPKTELTKQELGRMKGFKFNSFFEPSAIPIAIITAFIGFGYSSVLSFLTSYSKEIHLVDVASFFFIVYAAVILVSRPFTGRWLDSKGENFVMYPAFLCFSIGLLVLSQVHQGYFLLVAGVFVGLGYGTLSASAQAISIKGSPKHRIGIATSTYFIFLDGGIGVGPFLLGFLVPSIGYRGLYIFMGIIMFTCIFLYYFLHGRKAALGEQLAKAS